jgi:hypothetical protein
MLFLRGIKLLTNKWKGKNIDNDLNEFINNWEVNYKTRLTDQVNNFFY